MNEFIQVIDVLKPEEISKVISFIQNHKFQPSQIFSEEGLVVNESIRSSSRLCLDESLEITQMIHEKMNRGLDKYLEQLNIANPKFNQFPIPGSSWTKCWREGIQILNYNEGEHYRWHYDQGYKKEENAYYRTISIILYLQNAEEGGRTLFSHRGYKLREGQALIFPSNWCYPHESEEVKKGNKIVAVTWYYSEFNS